MNKTCTLEQAKRLKELGVEQGHSYFIHLDSDGAHTHHIGPRWAYSEDPRRKYAAFDTDELLNMLPAAYNLQRMGAYYAVVCDSVPHLKLHTWKKHPASAIADFIITRFKVYIPRTPCISVTAINERIRK